MIVIDIESSGLGPESYPIELAWVDLEDGSTFESLINPESAGGWDYWDPQAEEIFHGISRTKCRTDGKDVLSLGRQLNARFLGKSLISDAPEYDGFWLDRLFQAISQDRLFALQDVRTLFGETHRQQICNRLFTMERPHRALADCLEIAKLIYEMRCR